MVQHALDDRAVGQLGRRRGRADGVVGGVEERPTRQKLGPEARSAARGAAFDEPREEIAVGKWQQHWRVGAFGGERQHVLSAVYVLAQF